MALNKRQERILAIMDDLHTWITGKKLAKLLHVSDRTIRCDIHGINHHYKDTIIVSDQHHGYTLHRTNMCSLVDSDKQAIPQTPHERCIYILQELLFQRREVHLGTIQDELFVSAYSIENDVKRVRERLVTYDDLRLVRAKQFIHLKGSEKSKRQLYKDLLAHEAKGNFLNMDKLASLFKEFDFLMVKQILDETLEEASFSIREMTIPMVMMHIGVAIERMIHHNFVQTEVRGEKLKESKEYQIANVFFKKVSNRIRIEVIEEEIVRFALLLLGKRSSEFTKDSVILKNQEVHITQLVEALLQDIYDQFEIDVRGDGDLQVGLHMHLQSLFERQIQGIPVTNVYLQEIKKKYPLVFEMGVHSGNFLNERTNVKINENELGFLALHLGSAYERSRQAGKFQVLLLCPDNQSVRKVCIQKIEQRFSQNIDIVECVSVFEEVRVQAIDPDFIITTLPLVHQLGIMTEQISVFMNQEDERKIYYALTTLEKQKSRKEFQGMINAMMRPELWFHHGDWKHPVEVIHCICDRLEEQDWVPNSFRNDVLKREELSSTSFLFGFAIPHALNVHAKRSCLSIALLKHPIGWGEFDVRFVILIAVKEGDKNYMPLFFDWLDHVVKDSNKYTALLKSKTYEEFIAQIVHEQM